MNFKNNVKLSLGPSSRKKLKHFEGIISKDEYVKKTDNERWKITTDTIRNVDIKTLFIALPFKKVESKRAGGFGKGDIQAVGFNVFLSYVWKYMKKDDIKIGQFNFKSEFRK